jgi:hypothetical protein
MSALEAFVIGLGWIASVVVVGLIVLVVIGYRSGKR